MRRVAVAVLLGLSATGLVAQADPTPPIEHVIVQPGEGLWSVARRLCPHDTATVYVALQAANPWYTVGLHPGTVLHVPSGACPPPTTTTTSTTTTSTVPPVAPRFPTVEDVGVPDDWEPTQTFTGTYIVAAAGAVIEDIRVTGRISVRAPNVTLRRVEVVGGDILTQGCQPGLLLEDTSVIGSWNGVAIGTSAYTARRVLINGPGEGFRLGSGCGPVFIEDSYARVVAPDPVGDWHGDALQDYPFNDALTIRNTVLDIIGRDGSRGTAALNFGGTQVDIDGVIASGGSITVRLNAPGTVRALHVIDQQWTFGPRSGACNFTVWDAHISILDPEGQPLSLRPLTCP